MLAPYRQILTKPGAWKFSLAGLLGRFPMSMAGIGIVLMVSDASLYGSYALAGQVSAAFIAAQAIAAPLIARLVDWYGQARIMRPAILVSMSSMVALGLAATRLAPEVVIFGLAILVGATMGSLGSLVRTRWNQAVDNPRELHTAYSLEGVFDEVVFVLGPILATVLATTVHPTGGIALTVLTAVVGGFWFLAQRESEPEPSPRVAGQKRSSLLRTPEMLLLVVVFVFLGMVFGGTDVSTVAFAEESGNKALAGAVLACFAGGSLVGGLLYGAREWRTAPWTRFAVGTVALAVGVSLFFFTTQLWMLAVVMVVVGGAIAPTLITGNALVQVTVPRERLTEGLTWVGTALGIGVAAGSAVAGPLIDTHGSHAGYLVCLGAGLVMATLTLVSVLYRRRRAHQVEELADALPTQ